VLCPTRELSGQVLNSFRAYGRHLRIRTALAIGGVSMGAQVRTLLNGVDVLVATPGRLMDLVKSNALHLGGVEFLVIDEADRMLDMGFIVDVRKIVSKLPVERQTLLFSATMPGAIVELAAHMLRNPARVAVTPVASTVERIEQRIIHVDRGAKPIVLVDVLRHETIDRSLIFTRTKHGADKVARSLIKVGIAAGTLHGNKSQAHRERVLASFRKGDVKTLVATDIAARGLDVDGISHVVNFDLPNVPETYVHRIGRTARAGADGVAISLCDAEEAGLLHDIEKLIRKSIPATDRRAHSDRPQMPASRGHPTPRSTRSSGRQQRRRYRDDPARSLDPQTTHQQSERRNGQREQAGDWSGGISSVAFLRDAPLRGAGKRSAPRSANKDGKMAKEEPLQFEGLVTEMLPDARYRVQLDAGHG
jgi:superfamily II DNA/RNA helicase